MSNGVPYADIIILALIAGFILLRLRNVLGQKGEHDQPDFLKRIQPHTEAREPIVQLADKSKPKAKSKEDADSYITSVTDAGILSAIRDIKARDPQFTATQFLEGARLAFEMVFEYFAKGEKTPLKALLSEPLFEEFSKEIDARAAEEQHSETTLVSVVSKDITKAAMAGNMARITVRFVSEQITVVRNKKGEIVEGNPSETNNVEDEWVFERDVTTKNPNWKIVET